MTVEKNTPEVTRQTKFGAENMYSKRVGAASPQGKASTTKIQKVRKVFPPGLSEHNGKVLTKVNRRAYHLDCALFTFLGINFGWGSVIGLIPCAGDIIDCLLALMVVHTADQIEGGLPFFIKFKMLLNIAFDFVIGLPPFVGDIIDAMFKANTRNAVLLETYLRDQVRRAFKSGKLPFPDAEPSDPKNSDSIRGLDRQEQHGEEGHLDSPPARLAEGVTSSQETGVTRISHRDTVPITAPKVARVRKSRRWLVRSKNRQTDLEAGHVMSS